MCSARDDPPKCNRLPVKSVYLSALFIKKKTWSRRGHAVKENGDREREREIEWHLGKLFKRERNIRNVLLPIYLKEKQILSISCKARMG